MSYSSNSLGNSDDSELLKKVASEVAIEMAKFNNSHMVFPVMVKGAAYPDHSQFIFNLTPRFTPLDDEWKEMMDWCHINISHKWSYGTRRDGMALLTGSSSVRITSGYFLLSDAEDASMFKLVWC